MFGEIQKNISDRIKARAAELGFDLCRITTADPPPNHGSYHEWIDAGYAGEMGYLARQELKRGDLDAVLPGARSVVCVALNYSPDDGHVDVDPAAPAIARYARFDDYHETIWRRLEALLADILTWAPQATGKVYCDTGPVTERDLAMRAGIGWIGKHTNLISRQLGNWFFLGEVILDIDLPVDAPDTPHCGTCTRCIPACPTGAIVAPYKLDARRCISYLTIELKGSIPEEMRPLIGARIYGCDDCLAACPWNKFARASSDLAVTEKADLRVPDLIDLLSLDDEAFRTRFRNSPIRRTKRRGLLRNVCVALGNIGDESSLTPLMKAAESDPEPLVRGHAQWAIDQIQVRSSKRA